MSSFLIRATIPPAISKELKHWTDIGFQANDALLASPERDPMGGWVLKKGDHKKECLDLLRKRGFQKTGYPLWLKGKEGVSVCVEFSNRGATRGYTTVGFMPSEDLL